MYFDLKDMFQYVLCELIIRYYFFFLEQRLQETMFYKSRTLIFCPSFKLNVLFYTYDDSWHKFKTSQVFLKLLILRFNQVLFRIIIRVFLLKRFKIMHNYCVDI